MKEKYELKYGIYLVIGIYTLIAFVVNVLGGSYKDFVATSSIGNTANRRIL